MRVFSIPADDRNVDAFSFWRANRPFIFVNTAKSAERVPFDLAHELGHVLLHRGWGRPRPPGYEHDADVFAANLLMPADAVYAHFIGRVRLDDVLNA
jgi:Zn-dependent peptidase ImmA (M78 family)